MDCKLARETKAETVLQLCLYSQLLAELQGTAPEFFHVIRPGTGFEPESYRLASFAAYYRVVKRALQVAVQAGAGGTYPEPASHCEICRWWKECDGQRRRDDHLSFVAGASKLQRKELTLRQVPTLEALARLPLPIPFNPSCGAVEGYTRIREQARIQLEARIEGKLKFELLRCEPGDGFSRLPLPSTGDIFLDLEGDPFVADGGLEYLFGVVTADENGELAYECHWALDRGQERAAFEWFVDFTFERLRRFPDLHIYHFGVYEPGAIKRLVLRYATREEEVDRLLRGKVFIDLHGVVKQGVRASVEQYSLKDLERFCGYRRRMPLPEADQARRLIEHQLKLSPSPALADDACRVVEAYNEDDCLATAQLRQWLEDLRAGIVAGGTEIPRPETRDTSASDAVTAHQQRVAALFAALTQDLPAEPKDRTPEQAARWLLAHALDWHRREEKVKWWEFFRMKEVRLQWFRRVIITTMNIERFKQRLREKEIELQSEMERLGEEVRVSGQAEVGDPADAATSSQGISESLQEDTLTSQTLIQVQDALRRIEDGTYGKCIACGRPIEAARLEAIPWAQHCLEDQEKQEKAAHVPQGGSTL